MRGFGPGPKYSKVSTGSMPSDDDTDPTLSDGIELVLDKKNDASTSESSAVSSAPDDEAAEPACRGALGLVFMALSTVAYSTMTLLVHILGTTYRIPSFQLITARSGIGFLAGAAWVVLHRKELCCNCDRSTQVLLLLRGLAGVASMAGIWFMLAVVSLGEATVIIFTSPMITVVAAHLLLSEHMSQVQVLMLLLSTLGVVLVARPSFLGFEQEHSSKIEAGMRGWAIAAGLISACCEAAINVMMRRLRHVNVIGVTTVSMFISLIVSPLLLMLLQTPAPINEWLVGTLLLAIGILGLCGQLLKNKGLQMEKAGPASMIRNLDLVLAIFYQVTLLHEPMHYLSIVGSVLIIVSSIVIAILKIHFGD